VRRLPFVIALASVAVLALVAGVILLGETSTAQDLDLDGVSADELRQGFGVVLEPPRPEDRASVGPERALEVARSERGPDTKAREVILARIHEGSGRVVDGQLVWVVNLDPGSFLPIPPLGLGAGASDVTAAAAGEQRAAFSLIYVDAVTGEFLFGQEKGYDPDPTD